MISALRLKELAALVAAGREAAFYGWPEWLALREDVLKLDRYECQRCRQEKHRFRRAKIVHHVKHLRQLISVCKSCHEELHPESQRQFKRIRAPLTAERWD